VALGGARDTAVVVAAGCVAGGDPREEDDTEIAGVSGEGADLTLPVDGRARHEAVKEDDHGLTAVHFHLLRLQTLHPLPRPCIRPSHSQGPCSKFDRRRDSEQVARS
jgi:hypothetical protein